MLEMLLELPSLKLTANLPLKINRVFLGSKPEAVSFREILLELLLMVQKSGEHHLGCIPNP